MYNAALAAKDSNPRREQSANCAGLQLSSLHVSHYAIVDLGVEGMRGVGSHVLVQHAADALRVVPHLPAEKCRAVPCGDGDGKAGAAGGKHFLAALGLHSCDLPLAYREVGEAIALRGGGRHADGKRGG